MIAVTNNVAASASDIRDIKPPIEISSGLEWLWILLGALAILAILFFATQFWKKRRANIPLPPPIPAHVRAKQKLQESLELISQPKEFCVLVSDTVRFYLEEQFNFRAPERTTEEFLRELNATDLLSVEQKDSLGEFLESCDLVKFAKYEPGENELRGLHGSAVKLVEETEPREYELASAAAPAAVRGALASNMDSSDPEREARSAAPDAGALPNQKSQIVNRKS